MPLRDAMFVSESTAQTHLRRILTRLGLRDHIAAVISAYESALMWPGADKPI
jgi:DNA-binding NarL/FixJ family response regulator